MATHTPEPWSIVKILHGMSGFHCDIVAENGSEICEMTHAVSTDEMMANAALIAAAPLLLKACKALLDAGESGMMADWYPARDQVTIAIAAAEGASE